MNGKQLVTTISPKAINALIQCAESIVIPSRSNGLIKCKAPKATCGEHYEKVCIFEPSNRCKSDFSEYHTYEGTVVMGDKLKDSGIFHNAMTTNSGRHVKITQNTNMELLKSCPEDKICTIHKVVTFHILRKNTDLKLLKRICMQFPLETSQDK